MLRPLLIYRLTTACSDEDLILHFLRPDGHNYKTPMLICLVRKATKTPWPKGRRSFVPEARDLAKPTFLKDCGNNFPRLIKTETKTTHTHKNSKMCLPVKTCLIIQCMRACVFFFFFVVFCFSFVTVCCCCCCFSGLEKRAFRKTHFLFFV